MFLKHKNNGSNDKYHNNNRNKRIHNNNRIPPHSRHMNLAMDSTAPFNNYYSNRHRSTNGHHRYTITMRNDKITTEYYDDNKRQNSNYNAQTISSKRFKSSSSWCSYADFEADKSSESNRIRNDEELSESSSVQSLGSIHGSRTVIDLVSIESEEETSADDFKSKLTEQDLSDKSSSSNLEKDKDLINVKDELKKFDDILSKYQMNLNKISENPLSNEDNNIIGEYSNIIISIEEDSRIKEIIDEVVLS